MAGWAASCSLGSMMIRWFSSLHVTCRGVGAMKPPDSEEDKGDDDKQRLRSSAVVTVFAMGNDVIMAMVV